MKKKIIALSVVVVLVCGVVAGSSLRWEIVDPHAAKGHKTVTAHHHQ